MGQAEAVFSVDLMLSGINTPVCAIYIVDKPVFTLGKSDSNDGAMGFSDEISREHARIDWTRQGYTITDLDSTNGTYLNGIMLRPNEPQPLRSGDRVMFSTFQFAVESIRR